MFFQFRVYFQHFPAYREEEVGNGFYYLYGAEHFAFVQRFAFGGDVYKDDVTQLVLCIICNAYIRFFTFQANPFVFVRVRDFKGLYFLQMYEFKMKNEERQSQNFFIRMVNLARAGVANGELKPDESVMHIPAFVSGTICIGMRI